MIKLYDKKIEYGMCDTNACIKPVEILKIIEAAVASFFAVYSKDNLTIKKEYQALWLFTKTKYEVERLPLWNEEVHVEACRASFDSKLVAVIEIYIHPKDQAEGIHAWVECTAASIATRKLLRLSAIDFTIAEEKTGFIGFSKWERIEDYEEVYQLKVTASYLDYSRHVNNAEYVRILMDSFSLKEIEQLSIKTLEIHYLKESYEQDELHIFRTKQEQQYCFSLQTDLPIVEMRMEEEK